MKVKELQEQLGKLDPNCEVICYTEDEPLQTDETIFRILEIQSIHVFDGEMTRLEDQTPYLKLVKSSRSKKFASINVTLEF